MLFSQNLKKLLEEKGITPAELSRMTGISRASLSQYLSNKNRPSKKRIEQIAAALEVELEVLFKEPEPKIDETGKRKVYNVGPERAARLLGVSDDFIKKGLQERIFPWGYAVKQSSRWTYYINSVKFAEIEHINLG